VRISLAKETAMTRYLIAYGASLVTLLLLDLLWLGLAMREFYKNELGAIMRERPLVVPSVLFYVIYVIGLTWFATLPGLDLGDWKRVALVAAAFGFFAYATYDITNFATLKIFPLTVVFVDIAWGMVVSALAASAGYFASTIGK
jgi:uncharacterized membrane protein